MTVKTKYSSLGNRRDKNLSDVDSPSTALGNLLDGLSGAGNFTSDDLDAIRGIRFERIDQPDIYTLSGTTVFVTNPNDPTGNRVPSSPLVTIRDRVQIARLTTGEIPAYSGGLGLDARFIRSTEINAGNVNSTGSDIFIFNSEQIIEKDYWEYGHFKHESQLDSSFSDQYGGIQWTGYFSPYIFNDNPTVNYQTTGLLIVEYDIEENDNWVKVANLYAQTRQVTATAGSTGTTVQIAGQRGIVSVNDRLVSNPTITIVSVEENSITLSNNLTVTNGQTLQFTKTLGETLGSNRFSFPTVEPGKFIKVRISYWYPDNGQTIKDKTLIFDYVSSYFTFNYLYSAKSEAPGPDEIRTFLDDALSPYNSVLGEAGTAGSNYRDLNIAKTYINNYEPKNTLAGIRSEGPATITFTAGSKIVTCSVTTDNIKIGDFVIPSTTTGTAIPTRLQVKEKIGSNKLILDKELLTTGTRTVNFIDHKGFINWFFATSTGSTVTVSDTTGLASNNVIITASTSIFTRINSILSPTTFSSANSTALVSLGLTTSQPIYIYSEKGLSDNSKTVFCQGVFGAVLFSNAISGSTTLVMSSNTGIVAGQVVQYSGIIPETPPTTVVSIVGNTVTLSNAITAPILQNSTIVFAPSGTDVNKEICIIPLDTAPPFLGTNDGLNTAQRGLKSSDTLVEDFTVETGDLVLFANTSAVTTVSGVQQYDRKIRLNNNQYFIIGKSV